MGCSCRVRLQARMVKKIGNRQVCQQMPMLQIDNPRGQPLDLTKVMAGKHGSAAIGLYHAAMRIPKVFKKRKLLSAMEKTYKRVCKFA